MGSVKYGSIVTEIKGKLGGHVFQKCGQSLSIRTNSSKRLPQSKQAVSARHNVSYLASYWKNLTQAQKDSYTNNAHTFPTVDKYGNPIILTGYQLFFSLAAKLLLVPTDPVDNCVTYSPPSISDIDFDPFDISTSQFNLLYNNPIASTEVVLLYVSDPLPGTRYIKSPKYRFCTIIQDDAEPGDNYFLTVSNSFSTPPKVGYSFYWLAVKIDYTTGQNIIDNGAAEFIYT